MTFPPYNGPVRLDDCQVHGLGSEAELLIVEGISAGLAVSAVRDPVRQAVLPMQGKPLNASKARRQAVLNNPLFQAIMSAVGPLCPEQPETMRYERIVLLCDPDADGIHCGALLLIFIYQYLQPWLDSGRVCQVNVPLVRIDWVNGMGVPQLGFAHSLEQAGKLVEQLKLAGYSQINRKHYRGLGGIDQETLREYCVAPKTRRGWVLDVKNAEAALKCFGRKDDGRG